MCFINIKNFGASVDIIKKVKRHPQSRRKDLQIIYLMRDLCLAYIKNTIRDGMIMPPKIHMLKP